MDHLAHRQRQRPREHGRLRHRQSPNPIDPDATVSVGIEFHFGGTESDDFNQQFSPGSSRRRCPAGVSFDGVATLTFDSAFNGDFNFSLPTFNDGLIEGDENFTVALTPSSATTTATNASVGIGAANSVDTTITDNDTLTISLTGSGTVPESTAAAYTGNFFNPIDPDATVSVGIEFHFGGTESDDFNQQFLAAVQAAADAQAGVSFDGVATLTFDSAFSGNFNFSLPTFNDSLDEGDETFTVALTPSSATTTATNASVGIGAANSVDTTITDNDQSVISIANTSVVEGGNLVFTVTRTLASEDGQTVDYTVTLGTAEAGDISSALTGTVTFAPGQLTQTITVGTVDDVIYEGDETVTVTLNNPQGASPQATPRSTRWPRLPPEPSSIATRSRPPRSRYRRRRFWKTAPPTWFTR